MRGKWDKLFEIKYTKAELKEEFDIEMWDDKKITTFQKVILDWYDEQEHDFPWRRTKNPYNIWVSEIMLQQTQVNTVIPYYERFLEEFPTIADLAEASEDKVLKLWEGLGYYSRARNLKEAATQIMLHYDGEFPDTPKEMSKLKGIGPYTAGAISSMAFNLPTPAIDGNLMRVLSRLFEIDLDVSKQKNRKVFATVASYLIDHERPGDFNQALMDLGRTICTPKNYFPEQSPVKEFNASYLNDTWQEYPVKKPENKPKPMSYIALIIKNDKGEYLFKQRPETGLLANMWMFPLIEVEDIISDGTWKSFKPVVLDHLDEEQKEFVEQYVLENQRLDVTFNEKTSGIVSHTFSHLKWKVSLFETATVKPEAIDVLPEQFIWVNPDEFKDYAFPTVQKKFWDALNEITLF